MNMGLALFHVFVNLVVLICGQYVASSSVQRTALLASLALAPLILFTMGISWFVSLAGVYFRDLSQASCIVSTMMLFLSPVFYPLSIVPEDYRAWFYLNPLTYVIELLIELVVSGTLASLTPYLLYCGSSLVVACLCFAWFQKTRRGFADVV